jgi:hypothetical protein
MCGATKRFVVPNQILILLLHQTCTYRGGCGGFCGATTQRGSWPPHY